MALEAAIILAALGITTLELVEAAAVGLTLYHSSKRKAIFGAVAAGTLVVLIPTFVLGSAISLLPVEYVRLVAAVLLLYFGIRLARSARRSVARSRSGGFHAEEESHRSMMAAAFSVGMVEAFEAAIVLVALLPISFDSTVIGLSLGVVIVLISTAILQTQVRKVKQASMKVAVSALLLSFSSFWALESVHQLNDLVLVPLFVAFVVLVYFYSHRGLSVPTSAGTRSESPPQPQ